MEEQEDNEGDQFFFSHAAQMPEDDIILSEVAILTGGRDQHGRAIIAFPAKYHGILESKVKASGMEILLRYFIDITRVADRKRGFAFVTDLRFSTLDFVLLLKSTLNSLQAEMKGAIGTCVLYVVLPLNKKTSKSTLTHLALRQSKKKINKSIIPPYFQCVAVADEAELYNYIEKSHLTPDLEGYLQYCHQDWVKFRRTVEPYLANFEAIQVRLPSAYQRLTALGNVTVKKNKAQLQDTHSQLQDAYNEIERSLHLDEVLQQFEQLLPRFGSCNEEDVFAILAQKPIFKETKETMEKCFEILTTARRKIREDWREISGRFTRTIQFLEYRADVGKMLDWFGKEMSQQRDVEIADTLSRAEMLCMHYQTGPVVKAKEKVSRAGALVQRGETLAKDNGNRSRGDILALARKLEEEALDFQAGVQKRQETLQSIYHFHQLYIKARQWYVKSIRFLPSNLQELFFELSSGRADRALRLQWEEDVRRFLHKHPLLEREELKKIKSIPEDVGALNLKRKGRLLSYRCLKLTDLLSHNGKTSSANIKDLMKWRGEIHNHSDDMSSNQSEILPSSGQMRKSPSDSSLDVSHESQRRKRPDTKRQSRTSAKNRPGEREQGNRQSQERPGKHNRQNRGAHSDANSNTANETDSEDPLISRLGKAVSFYNKQREAQVHQEGPDEVDRGRPVEAPVRRSMSSDVLYHLAAQGHLQLPTPPQRLNTPTHDLNARLPPPTQPPMGHAETYGIYGDSEFEDDTAVVIHRQGSTPLPQGFPQDQLPGNQVNRSGSFTPGNVATLTSPDAANVSGNQASYGIIQQEPSQPQRDPRTDLGRATPSGQLNPPVVTPAHLSTNNSNYLPSPQSSHSLPPNYPRPSLTPQQRPHANFVTSPRQAPMSFHGSLMNIHQSPPHHIAPHPGGGDAHAFNSSPVSRHRSMVDLSRSPVIASSDNADFPRVSPVRTHQQQVMAPQPVSNMSHVGVREDNHPVRRDASTSQLQHGVSAPNVNMSRHNTVSPYSDILDSLTNLRGRMNATPTLSAQRSSRNPKRARRSPSRQAVSQSALDLRFNDDSNPNNVSYSEHPSHRNGTNPQEYTSPVPGAISQDIPLGPGVTDAQAEYYRKLYSPSGLNQSTTASGHRSSDLSLDPSQHTWMHRVPPPRTKHQARLLARLHQTPRPLSPLSLLELEVAKETKDAQESAHQDEYNAEQSRRQAVIDDILDQSGSATRSHDTLQNGARMNLSVPEKVNRSNGNKDHKSKRRHRQRRNNLPTNLPNGLQMNGRLSDDRFSSSPSPTKVSHLQNGSVSSGNGLKQSINVQRVLSNTERQLGLSTTLPQEQDILPTEPVLNQYSRISESTVPLPTFTNGISSEKLLSVSQGERLDSEGDWRQQHLRELGLSPQRLGPSGDGYGTKGSLPRSNLTSPSMSGTNWRQQHLQDLGLSPTVLPASFQQQTASDAASVNRSTPSKGDWRTQHLLELGLSPNMHQGDINQNLTSTTPPGVSGSKKSQLKKHHLTEPGAPNTNHPMSLANGSVTDTHQGSDWRANHLKDLGLSPSVRQYPSPRSSTSPGGGAGSIAPVTDKLRGMLSSGQSFNEMEDVHRLANESTKKSVRFAQLSDEGILDAEEEVQDELQLRLLQLELKLQEEEIGLNHQHVLDTEELSLDQQLHDLNHQERRIQVDWDDDVRVEGAVPNHPRAASAWSGRQAQPDGNARLTNASDGQYVSSDTNPNHPTLLEDSIQPTHLQSHHQFNLQNMLQHNDPVTTEKVEPRSKGKESGRATNHTSPRDHLKHPQTQGVSSGDGPASDQSKMQSQSKLSQDGQFDSRSKPEPDQVVIPSSVERTDSQSPENRPNNFNLELRLSQLNGAGSILTDPDDHLPESQKHGKKLTKQFSMAKDDPVEEVNSTPSSKKELLNASGLQSQGAVKKRNPPPKNLDKITTADQRASESMISDSTHDGSRVGNRLFEGDEEYQVDGVYPGGDYGQGSLSERAHSAADYIACALGMEYVNKEDLTVQPFSDSSQHSHRRFSGMDDFGYPQSQQSVEGTSPRHSGLNNSQTESTLSESVGRPSGTDREGGSHSRGSLIGDDTEVSMSVEGLKHPQVKLPSSSNNLPEGPCSPIRQWLKEKESMESDDGPPDQSKMESVDKSVDQDAMRDVLSPSIESQRRDSDLTESLKRTSPMREWLREKQAKEAHESNLVHEKLTDLESSNGSMTNGLSVKPSGRPAAESTDDISPGRGTKQESPTSRKRTNSLIPVLIGPGRSSDFEKRESPGQQETRRRSSSSIPVYKGLSKTFPPKSKDSPSFGSPKDQPAVSQASHASKKEPEESPRAKSPYSKIPVSKVYSALKEGGFLDTRQQSPPQVSSTEKQSKTKIPQSKEPRPRLEKQETYTKETKPKLKKEGTFTVESDEDNGKKEGASGKGKATTAPLPPLALVLDHMVKKGGTTGSRNQEDPSVHGQKKDSVEEPFENSSTESSMSPTSRSAAAASKHPTTNIYSTKNIYIHSQNGIQKDQGQAPEAKSRGSSFEGLTESDRLEHSDLDDSELERMIATKSQLAEIRNLEIENRHLAYEKKEYEAQYIKSMKSQKPSPDK